MADSGPPIREGEIDWDATRSRLRGKIIAQLGKEDASVEDLTQQALIDILRLVRRDGARNLDGLVQVVARSTAIDEIRRRQRTRARHPSWESSLDLIEAMPNPGTDHWTDSAELLWFLLLEFFREHQAPCHDLARMYAELGTWDRAAESLGQSCDATRQQWSRCVKSFRRAIEKDPGPFKDWLDA